MATPRQRLDLLVVAAGLAPNQRQAQALIRAGQVLADDVVADKPGTQFAVAVALRVRRGRGRYVSRGGEKLQAGLDRFGVDPGGLICADLGASTGGFTDCLLLGGARRVFAIDVGYGQLAWSLRTDDRVTVMERTNARYLDTLPDPVDLVVGDLSFIGLRQVLPAIIRISKPGAGAILLVKPQFELARGAVDPGGVVRDEATRLLALDAVRRDAADVGCTVLGTTISPILGAKKRNVEYLIHLRLPDSGPQQG